MALWPKKPKPDEKSISAPLAPPPQSPEPQSPEPQSQPDMPAAPHAMPIVAHEVPEQVNPPPAGQAAAPLSAQDAQKRAIASKQLSASFGGIVAVLMRSPQFRSMPLSELEGLVVPAVMTGQFLLAETQSKSNGFLTPVAAALWATVSDDIDRRLSENLDQPVRLTADEWKSGPTPWMIAVIGDQRVVKPMLRKLQDTTLQGRPFKMRMKGQDGKTIVGHFAATPEGAAPAPPQG